MPPHSIPQQLQSTPTTTTQQQQPLSATSQNATTSQQALIQTPASTIHPNAKKKTSFQITSVKVHDGHERTEESTVDENAEALTGSNGDDGKSVPTKKHSITDPSSVAEQWQRRFKVVKIPFSEPFKRGRWTCQDFFDPPEGQKADDKTPHPQPSNQVNVSPESIEGHGHTLTEGNIVNATVQLELQQTAGTIGGGPGDEGGKETSQSATEADGNYSAVGAGGIDNKIEQAMDLVKSHLMFAVREEVDVLQEKITELIEKVEQLTYENQALRSLLTPEQLQRFILLQQQQKVTPRPAPAQTSSGHGTPQRTVHTAFQSLAAFSVPQPPRSSEGHAIPSSGSPAPLGVVQGTMAVTTTPGSQPITQTSVQGLSLTPAAKPVNPAVAGVAGVATPAVVAAQQPTVTGSLPATLINPAAAVVQTPPAPQSSATATVTTSTLNANQTPQGAQKQ